MDLTNMTREERYAMMRKRHAILCAMVRPYTSLEEFAKEKDEWFAMLGVELRLGSNVISLYMSLDYDDYETYYVIPGKDGRLTISEVISWQDPYCYNDDINIFTEESVEEDEIATSIHNYGEEYDC